MQFFPTDVCESAGSVSFPQNAVIIHGLTEQRSEIPNEWRGDASSGLTFCQVVEADNIIEFALHDEPTVPIFLRRKDSMAAFIGRFTGRQVFLDVTGLSHHVWMPILKILVELGENVSAIYAEPAKYTISTNPRPSEFFDLSERIRGVSPIPMFARVARRGPQEPTTAALLGFEGARFKYLLETLQPEGDSVYPIIGVPGFQMDYPFHTYEGNADPLETSHSWPNVHFVDAACPFSLYHTLLALKTQREGARLRIATIGTKPHALGAAIYAILNDEAELVYDHPVRKKGRTSGAGRCHVYHISQFISSLRPNL